MHKPPHVLDGLQRSGLYLRDAARTLFPQGTGRLAHFLGLTAGYYSIRASRFIEWRILYALTVLSRQALLFGIWRHSHQAVYEWLQV